MTDLAELKRLAEAATRGTWFVAPNGSAYYGSEPAIFSTEHGPRGPKICSAAWGFATKGGKADYYFIAAANPSAILSLIQRVEEVEVLFDLALQNTAEITRRASEVRRETLAEAAQCADNYDQSPGDDTPMGPVMVGQVQVAQSIAQAIRALKEKA